MGSGAGRLAIGALAVMTFPLPTVLAPASADAVMCGGQPATMVGTADDDVLVGTPGPDVIAGLEGDDEIRGRDGDDRICGDDGADVISGGRGDDRLHGGLDGG